MENIENENREISRRDALACLGKIAGAVVIPSCIATLLTGCASSRKNHYEVYYGNYAKNFYQSEFGSVNPNPAPEQVKQAYLKYGFMEYPNELDNLSKQLGRDGKILESIVTRGGWVLAVVNDVVERPVAAVAGFIGKAFGGKKGKQNMINFARYLTDGTIGGKTYTEFHKELFGLHGKGAVKIVYDSEPTKGGRAGKLIVIGASDFLAFILPFVKHGHHHAGAGAAGPGPTSGDPF